MDTVPYIRSRIESLSDTDAQIANYICDNPQGVSNMTSSALAKELDLAQSTIIKFIQRLGYKGYTDLRIQLAKTPVAVQSQGIHNHITLNDPLSLVAQKVGFDNGKAIADTCQNIDNHTLAEVIGYMQGARRIALIGIGASSLVAQDLAYKLLKLGKIGIHETDYHAQLSIASTMGKDDMMIAFSHSGYTKEVIIAVEQGKTLGAKVVAITGNSHTPLTTLADCTLYTVAEEGLLRSSAISSRIAQLTIVDILFLGLLQREERGMEMVERSRQIISQLKG